METKSTFPATAPGTDTDAPSLKQRLTDVHPTTWVALVLAIASIVMIALGWRERTTTQTLLLGMSNLPFSAAAALVLWRQISDNRSIMPRRLPGWLRASRYTVGFGLVLYLFAFTVGPVFLAPLGQFFIWLTLAFLYCVVLSVIVRKRTGRRVFLRQR